MENFFKKQEPSEEEFKKLRKQNMLRGIAQEIIELMAQNTPAEDIEKIIGKGFMENFGEGQNIQDKIMEGLKDSSDSEIETIMMRIETYKKLKEDNK